MSRRGPKREALLLLWCVVAGMLLVASLRISVALYWEAGIDDKVQAAIKEHERKAHP